MNTLVNGYQKEGIYTEVWDGMDLRGTKVPDGIYFYKLNTATSDYIGKLIRF